MRQLTKQEVKEYQRLCQQKLGIKIDTEKAREEGMKLIRMIKEIYRPVSR